MFVPVACSQCGKPFQVPEAALGNPAVCPWCQATVLALPVGKPAEQLPLAGEEAEPELLSLEDAPAAKPFPWWVLGAAAAAALAVAAGVTVLVLRYTREPDAPKDTSPVGKPFAAPDGSFRVELFENVREERGEAGGRRFVSEHAPTGVTLWVEWADLTPVQVQVADTDDAWKVFLTAFDAERDRLKKRYDGTVTREATTKFKEPLTREVRLDYAGGKVVEQMTVRANGPHPRMYLVGAAGKIAPDGPEAKRLFESFKVIE